MRVRIIAIDEMEKSSEFSETDGGMRARVGGQKLIRKRRENKRINL